MTIFTFVVIIRSNCFHLVCPTEFLIITLIFGHNLHVRGLVRYDDRV